MEQEAAPQRLALIDIGSNTIRSVVYEWRNGRARKRYSERDYTGLIAYVRHGRLSREGTRRLCEVLAAMQRFCALCRCSQVMAFSTASLRGIANQAAVLEAVWRQTGLEILPLSAEEEMACDCQALVRAGPCEASCGGCGRTKRGRWSCCGGSALRACLPCFRARMPCWPWPRRWKRRRLP